MTSQDLETARASERSEGELRWYCLSFAEGKEWLGMAVIQACGPVDAHLTTVEAGVDPGRGSVTMMVVDEQHLPPEGARGRLILPDEARLIWVALDTVGLT